MNSSRPYLRMNARNGPHSESSITASMADSRSVWLCCTQMVRNESAILRRISTSGSVAALCSRSHAWAASSSVSTTDRRAIRNSRSNSDTRRPDSGPFFSSDFARRTRWYVSRISPSGGRRSRSDSNRARRRSRPQDRPRPAALGERDEQQRLAGQGPDERRQPIADVVRGRGGDGPLDPAGGRLPRGLVAGPAVRPAGDRRQGADRPADLHARVQGRVRQVVLGHPPAVVLHDLVHPADRVGDLDLVQRLDELLQVAVPLPGRLQPRGRRVAGEPLGGRAVGGVDGPGGRPPQLGHGRQEGEPLFQVAGRLLQGEVPARGRAAAGQRPVLPVVGRVLERHPLVGRLVHVVARPAGPAGDDRDVPQVFRVRRQQREEPRDERVAVRRPGGPLRASGPTGRGTRPCRLPAGRSPSRSARR